MEEPAWLAEELAAAPDPNSVITEMGLAAKSEICDKTLDMFVSAYGAEAGNLALKVMSVGGMYIGGGIGPRAGSRAGGGGAGATRARWQNHSVFRRSRVIVSITFPLPS